MKTIHVSGRRWFQRTYGNTYFSAVRYVNGEKAVSIDFEYGYGEHYIDCIKRELEKAGYLPGIKEGQPLRQYCDERNIKLTYTSADVGRKKDL